jgi:hypothetical protein
MDRLIEAEVMARLPSSATFSGMGSRRSGRNASNLANSSADMARRASVKVRGRWDFLSAVTLRYLQGD